MGRKGESPHDAPRCIPPLVCGRIKNMDIRHILAAASVAVFSCVAVAAEPADRQFARLAAPAGGGGEAAIGQVIEVDVDLDASTGYSVDGEGEWREVRYRMAFNQIAEGWSWQPLADPAVEDYYRFKFLPLQSVEEARGDYAGEDKIGTPQAMNVRWRYDYFLAFSNLYDFYPRAVDDDAGFVASIPAARAAQLGMRAKARLIAPVTSESTTFWKAMYSRPTDFTLKKRYLVADLQEIQFVDRSTGRVLCAIPAGRHQCRAE